MEEIIQCPICKEEYSLLYDDEQVVAQTNCKCPRIKPSKKPLDVALDKLEFRRIK
jgi:hypothetical protein